MKSQLSRGINPRALGLCSDHDLQPPNNHQTTTRPQKCSSNGSSNQGLQVCFHFLLICLRKSKHVSFIFFLSRIFPQPSLWSVLPCWSGKKNLTIISLAQQFLMTDSVKLVRPVWLVVLVKTCQWCSRRTTLLAIWATCLMAGHRLAASPPVKRYATKMLEPLSSKSFSPFSCVPGCYGCLQWRFIHLSGATDQRGKNLHLMFWGDNRCEDELPVAGDWTQDSWLGPPLLGHCTTVGWSLYMCSLLLWLWFLSRYKVHSCLCCHFSSSCFYSNTTIIF